MNTEAVHETVKYMYKNPVVTNSVEGFNSMASI